MPGKQLSPYNLRDGRLPFSRSVGRRGRGMRAYTRKRVTHMHWIGVSSYSW